MSNEDFKLDLVSANVKATMKNVGASSSDLWQVPLDAFRIIPGFNVREHDDGFREHIAYLTNSIATNGFRQDRPLSGYAAEEDGQTVVYVLDGHCRLEGAQGALKLGAPIDRLPCVIKQNMASMDELTAALVTTNSGKPLSPYELGIVFKRLANFGWEPKKIADHVCMSQTYVDNLLFLMTAPDALKKLVREGSVSANTAIDTFRKHGAKAVDVLTKVLDGKTAGVADGEKVKVTGKDMVATDPKRWRKSKVEPAFTLLKSIYNSGDLNRINQEHRDSLVDLVEAEPGFGEGDEE